MCVSCHSPVMLDETFGSRRGLVSRVGITCSNSSCKKPVLFSSEDNCLIDAAILGTRMASCGHNALQELSACIGMLPPLYRPMWTKHNKVISATSTVVAKQCGVEAAQHLHEKMGKPLNEVIDVIVTVDGTCKNEDLHIFLGLL